MTTMPQLAQLRWDFADQLCMTSRQPVDDSDTEGQAHQGEQTYYVYDSAGQRVRKTTVSPAGDKLHETLYLGSYEVYRRYATAGDVTMERQTLHVMDDKQRIALVETLTISDKVASASLPQTVIRYQFGNHLGTVCLELDETGAVITYEEYYPYGSTSYQAGTTTTETSLKRYRYTGQGTRQGNGPVLPRRPLLHPFASRSGELPDPIGLTAGSDLFPGMYVATPSASDPSGHEDSEHGQSHGKSTATARRRNRRTMRLRLATAEVGWIARSEDSSISANLAKLKIISPTRFQDDGMSEKDFSVEAGIGKGAEGMGELAEGTNDAVSTVVAGPEAEVDELSARIISKVDSLMRLPKSLFGSLASESKHAKIRIVDAAESFFRRMSFEEAGQTLGSQALQASAKDPYTWISSSKF